MGVFEAAAIIVMLSLIFGTINNFIKRRYSAMSKRNEGRNESHALLEIEKMRQKERAEARKLYDKLATEKLDIIKTAVAMGHTHDELAELDARLEKLVGPEKLTQLLDETPTVKIVEEDLMDEDLEGEIARLAKLREKQA